ncbi:MAG: EVE domain-containing protein [Bacteroidetes bacterium]|nr:MAG: EVE domain-containing protein [Bacteroidota bacterium]PTM14322.1 MAG: EVE domain-containing protein [Bacteroidota bacterium]
MNYWLVKSEPSEFGFAALQAAGRSVWDGVRNYQARNNLRAMKTGDRVLFYHSREGLAIVGLAEVVGEAYPDPTAATGDWSAVDLVARQPLPYPVPLTRIKQHPALQNLGLVRNGRLSVMPVSAEEFSIIMELAQQGEDTAA